MSGFGELAGKTLTSVEVEEDRVIFVCDSGEKFMMHHHQDCCERVRLVDGGDDLPALVGDKIVLAHVAEHSGAVDYGSQTWTFYILATVKASATLRWLGGSNGYYSERVDFVRVEP